MKTKLFTLSLICSFALKSQIIPFTIQNYTGSNSITCQVQTISLAATGSYSAPISYSWISPTTTLTGSTYTITSPGTYTVLATSGTVSSSQTLSIGSNTTIPQVVLSPSIQSITCTLSSITTVSAIALSPTAQLSHQFMNPLGGTLTLGSSIGLFSPMTPGTYTYVLTDSINGCSVTKNFTVQGTGFPTFSVIAPLGYTIGCAASGIIIFQISNATTTPPGGPLSYTLLSPGTSSNLPVGALAFVSTYTLNSPGMWTLVTRDGGTGCESRVQVTVIKSISGPKLSIFAAPTRTLTCATPAILLTAFGPVSNNSYTWSPASSGNTLNATFGGSFVVYAKDALSCIGSTTIVLTNSISYPPIGGSVFGGLCSQSSDQIFPAGLSTNMPYSYSWTVPSNASVTTSNNPTITVNSPGIYTVAVTNTLNFCTSIAQLTVTNCVGIENNVVAFPQVFIYPIPVKDELNVEVSAYLGEVIKYKLYNSQGSLVYSVEAAEKVQLNLVELPSGTYFLKISCNNQSTGYRVLKE